MDFVKSRVDFMKKAACIFFLFFAAHMPYGNEPSPAAENNNELIFEYTKIMTAWGVLGGIFYVICQPEHNHQGLNERIIVRFFSFPVGLGILGFIVATAFPRIPEELKEMRRRAQNPDR